MFADAPEHFCNAPENLNPDPDFTPGDWPVPDPFAVRTVYYQRLSEMVTEEGVSSADRLQTIGIGEVRCTILKNETAEVLGYFRNFFGSMRLGKQGPEQMSMIVDINSLDTGVPGRNHRILDFFFQSSKPEWGTALLSFDRFDLQGEKWAAWDDGLAHPIRAQGTIEMNGVKQPVAADLNVWRSQRTWIAESREPIQLQIMDFNFGERVYAMMKSCNHKSVSNKVQVKVKLYLK